MPAEPCLIHEYALEPALLNTWETFRFFESHFGIETGRLISRYPKKWKSMVYDSIGGCSPVTKKRIEEALTRIDPRMMPRKSTGYDYNKSWLANACTEHKAKPFHAVIARENPTQDKCVLPFDDVEAAHPLWVANRALVVVRTPEAMAAAVAPLLQLSREICFIDPYFDPNAPRYRNAFTAFINAAVGEGRTAALQCIEVHASDKLSADYFFPPFMKYLSSVVPDTVKLKLVQWKQRSQGEKLHNRFILTDIGGVNFGTGLDAMDQGEGGQTDEVGVLTADVYRKRYAQYVGSTPAFDLVESRVRSYAPK